MTSIIDRLFSNLGSASSTVVAPTSNGIELTPGHTQWRLLLSTQVSATASAENLAKVSAILESWMTKKWRALRHDDGLAAGKLDRGDSEQHVRYDRSASSITAELIQRQGRNVWVTTVSAKPQEGKLCIAVQNGVFTHPKHSLAPNVPVFLRRVISELNAADGDIPVTDDGFVCEDDDTFEQMLDDLNCEQRQLPMVVLAPTDDEGNFSVDVDELSKQLFGAAHVVALTRETTAWLREYAGQELSVPRGGVRVYSPGFHVNADAELHPFLFMPSTVRSGELQTDGRVLAHARNLAFDTQFRPVRTAAEMAVA